MARMILVVVIALLLLMHSAVEPAEAGTDTDTLAVSVAVVSACSLAGGQLDFGTYTAGQTADLDAQGTIDYSNCNGNLTFELDGGQSGDINLRQMQFGANRISYQLYRNSARTFPFGVGEQAKTLPLTSIQSGLINVFGRIPRGQVVGPGPYSDTVNITLTF